MATLASVFSRFFPGAERSEESPQEADQATRLRAFANEDIYFFVKRIDNTRVVREIDPASGQACWKMIGSVVAAVVLLVSVLMPAGYGLLAGYQVQDLKEQRQRLEAESDALELQEAALLSPERMDELARTQEFVDPAPERVIFLENRDQEFAAAASPDRGKR